MPETPKIRHKRWRHKTRSYVVKVLDTRDASGCPMVTVDRTEYTVAPRTWTVQKFLLEFEPLGRPMRLKSVWDRM